MSSKVSTLLAAVVAVAFVHVGPDAQSQAPKDAGQQNRPVPDAKGIKRLPPLPRGRYPKINAAGGYKFVEGWPQRPPQTVWGQMAGIAIDPSGNIWTFNRGDTPVQAYRPDGALVTMWGQGMFVNPHQLRFDKAGNLWAVDSRAETVMKFSTDGRLLQTLGVAGERGEDDKHFNGPTDLAISPSGDVFISDGYGNNRIVHYDRNGRFVKAWGRLGSQRGELSLPHGIAVDSRGHLYVVERNNARVQVFDQSGKSLAEWRNIITPWAITITPKDEVYVVGSSAMQWWETTGDPTEDMGVPPRDQIVVRFDTDGRVQHLWSFPKGPEGKPHKPGDLTWVHTLAVAANGDLYLGDVSTGMTAQKFAFIKPDVLPHASR